MAGGHNSAKYFYDIMETQKAITEEEANFLRIINLILRVAPQAVRVKFDEEFFPGGLQKVLNQNKFKVLDSLKRTRVINQKQWDLLYPRTGKYLIGRFVNKVDKELKLTQKSNHKKIFFLKLLRPFLSKFC